MLRGNGPFRIWNLLEDVLSSNNQGSWAFIGCVSMEERSICAALAARQLASVSRIAMFRIGDDPTSRFYSESESRTDVNHNYLLSNGVPEEAFLRRELHEPFWKIAKDIEDFLSSLDVENLIFDITSMPKKIFFYLVKCLFRSEVQFRNILATYAEPEEYSDTTLAENPQAWGTLPGFDPPRNLPQERKVVIGIGFEPLGLPDLVMQGAFSSAKTYLLFPFPTPPDRIRKNWEFAKDLFPNPSLGSNNLHIEHVDGWNVPEVVDLLGRIGENGEAHMMLAPYGPKPVSLAMALYASRFSTVENPTAVYYTQPTSYNPYYSSGIRQLRNKLAIHCYGVKRLGKLLY